MQSRRDFIKTAAATAAVAATAVAGTALAEEAPAKNRVCEILGIEKPVIQASMSGLTSPELCAAVSNAGGLGMLGDAMLENIQATKELTDKPFGVTTYVFDDDFMNMCKDEGVNIVYVLGMGSVENGYWFDGDTIKKLKDNGFIVIYRDVNTTVPMLKQAEEAGADILIASGYGMGGHAPESRITLSSMLAEARPEISAPLMAAGCIIDTNTAAAAAALGAEGAWVGTRFNACDESPCSDAAKQVILETRAEDLVEWRGILGFVRANRTPMAEKCIEMDRAGATRQELSDVYQAMWPMGMMLGDLENYAVGMSDAVNSITELKPAAQIVEEIAAGFGC